MTNSLAHDLRNAPDLATVLRDDNTDLIARRDELIANSAKAPATIESEEQAKEFAEQIRAINALMKRADVKRVDAKEPYLKAGREIDGFYKGIIDPLAKTKTDLDRRLTAWQRKVADEERQRREAEAEVARINAAIATFEAEMERGLVAAERAAQAEAAALDAEKAALATPAELSRVRGDYGAVSSLRTVWVGEITDRATINLELLRPHLSLDCLQKALNNYVRAGGRELRGALIAEQSTTVVR